MAATRTRTPRTPNKVRCKREVMSEDLLDMIPTRDTSEELHDYDRDALLQWQYHRPMTRTSRSVEAGGWRNRDRHGGHVRRHTVSVDSAMGEERRPGFGTLNSNNNVFDDGVSSRNLVNQKQSAVGKALSATVSSNSMSILSRNIYKLWKNRQLCDVILHVDGQGFLAHRLVLATVSDLFTDSDDDASDTEEEYNVNGVSAAAMEDVLNYIYTSKLKIDQSNVEELLSISQQLGIVKLTQLCGTFLEKGVSVKNAVKNRELAEKYGIEKAASTINDFLHNNFETLASTPSFLKSGFNAIFDIVSSDILASTNELQIFHACASWIDFNRQSRIKYAVSLMGLVSFVNISPKDLVTEVEPRAFIFDISECKNMLYHAFRHHALYRDMIETENSKIDRRKSRSQEPNRRRSASKAVVSNRKANKYAAPASTTSSKTQLCSRRSMSSVALTGDVKTSKQSSDRTLSRSKSAKSVAEPNAHVTHNTILSEHPKPMTKSASYHPSKTQCDIFKRKFIEARSKHSIAEDQVNVSVANFTASKSKRGSTSRRLFNPHNNEQSHVSENRPSGSTLSLQRSSNSAFREVRPRRESQESGEASADPGLNKKWETSNSMQQIKDKVSGILITRPKYHECSPNSKVQAWSPRSEWKHVSIASAEEPVSHLMSNKASPRKDNSLVRTITQDSADNNISDSLDKVLNKIERATQKLESSACMTGTGQETCKREHSEHSDGIHAVKQGTNDNDSNDQQNRGVRTENAVEGVNDTNLDKSKSSISRLTEQHENLAEHLKTSNTIKQPETDRPSSSQIEETVVKRTLSGRHRFVYDPETKEFKDAEYDPITWDKAHSDRFVYDSVNKEFKDVVLDQQITMSTASTTEQSLSKDVNREINKPTGSGKRLGASVSNMVDRFSKLSTTGTSQKVSKDDLVRVSDFESSSGGPSVSHSPVQYSKSSAAVYKNNSNSHSKLKDPIAYGHSKQSLATSSPPEPQSVTTYDNSELHSLTTNGNFEHKPATTNGNSERQSTTTHDRRGRGMMPRPRRPSVVYIVGGINPYMKGTEFSSLCRMLQQFDPATNRWSTRRFIPAALHDCAVTVLGDKLFVTGGQRSQARDGAPSRDCYVYDIVKDTWRKIGNLNMPRTRHAAVALGNDVYVIGGEDSDEMSTISVEMYNSVSDRWKRVEPLKEPRVGLAAVTHRGNIIVVGGMMDINTRLLLDTVEVYDPRDGHWSYRARFPISVCGAAMAELDDVVYVVGGYVIRDGVPISVDSVFRYVDEVDCWVGYQTLMVPRHDAVAAGIGTRLYVIGGESSATSDCALSEVECIDVDTNVHVPGMAAMMASAHGISGCAHISSI